MFLVTDKFDMPTQCRKGCQRHPSNGAGTENGG